MVWRSVDPDDILKSVIFYLLCFNEKVIEGVRK
jgi:hypothetical protein